MPSAAKESKTAKNGSGSNGWPPVTTRTSSSGTADHAPLAGDLVLVRESRIEQRLRTRQQRGIALVDRDVERVLERRTRARVRSDDVVQVESAIVPDRRCSDTRVASEREHRVALLAHPCDLVRGADGAV